MDAMAAAVRPIKLSAVALEVIDEVRSAHAKHGPNKDLADGTGPFESIVDEAHLANPSLAIWDCGDNQDFAMAFKALNDKACADGRKHTRLGILLEEAFEAAECATGDDASLRKELIQVAAMALDWIVDIDDRASDTDSLDQED